MTEVIFVVKCGKPMSDWYHVYASGREDPFIYEQSLNLMLSEYNPTAVIIKYRFKCKDSCGIMFKFMEKIKEDSENSRLINGRWFYCKGIAHSMNMTISTYIKKRMMDLINS